jgi:hypothetical protein
MFQKFQMVGKDAQQNSNTVMIFISVDRSFLPGFGVFSLLPRRANQEGL